MNRAVLVVVVLAGLGAGWFGRAALEPSRPEAMLALFERYCLPRALTGREPPLDGLDRITLETGRYDWFDRRSRLLLSRSDKDCSVSDRLDPMSLAESLDVARLADDLSSSSFSQLTWDASNILGWPVFHFWHDGSPPGERSWGITVFRSPANDPQTNLGIDYPPQEPV